MKKIDKAVTFNRLNWDTDYFGVTSAKATLYKALTLDEWVELNTKFKDYQFISILNMNSEPTNAQLIGKETKAFLVDVNIQFEKNIVDIDQKLKNVTIHQALEKNDQIIDIADFKFSKFTEDPEFEKRDGDQVYRQWLINSFGKADNFYVLSKDEKGDMDGFLLFSYSDNTCVIELIAVSSKARKDGIGTSLFRAVEYEAYKQGIKVINVGTQVRNLNAINFYHKVGCKQIGCHQVYHLWNL